MISAIVAIARNHVIGKDNKLLWHMSNDLKRFKKTTYGNTIIMGRKTFESLTHILPERHHIVMTRNKEYQVDSDQVDSDQVTIVHSVGELIALLKTDEEYFVIGGGKIYDLLLPLCEKLYITKINKDFMGDSVFPILNLKEWEIIEDEEGLVDEKNPHPHQFMVLKRKAT